MKIKNIILSVITVISFALPLRAAELPPYSLNGYGFWQFGQVIKGDNAGTPIDRQWVTNALLGLRLETSLNERLKVLINPEFRLYFPFPELNSQVTTKRANSVAFINDMNGTILFGDVKQPLVEWRTGIFTYKYNDDARDFGEYMYRTGTYPPFVVTDFDFAKARLCGTSLRVNPIAGFSIDALLTSELLYAPLYDFSLAFIGKYSFRDIVSVGAGVDFARFLPVNDKKTSPDSTAALSNIDKIQYRKSNGTIGYYSFKATKLMACLSLDPKPFLPFRDIFSKADLKLYGEIALTGFPINPTNDTAFPNEYYNQLSRLMPMMAGFNVPIYSLVNKLVNVVSPVNIPLSQPDDVFAVEIEYFPSRMPNDYRDAMIGMPMPYIDSYSGYYPDMFRDREWGWSFYTKKEIIKGFSITAQVAYDHLRMSYVDGSTATNECLVKRGHWYWVVKTGYSF
jgi:hypothetical protein